MLVLIRSPMGLLRDYIGLLNHETITSYKRSVTNDVFYYVIQHYLADPINTTSKLLVNANYW